MHPTQTPHPRRWPQLLQVRLALLGMCAVVCAVGLTGWALLERAERDTVADRQRIELVEAEQAAKLLDQGVRSQLAALGVIGRGIDPAIVGNPDELERLLRSRPLLLSQFDSVFVARSDGQMQLIHNDKGWSRPQVNLADRSYFREAVHTGLPVVSEPLVGRVAVEPVVVLAQPLHRDGQVVGVIGGGIRLRSHPLLAGLASATGRGTALVMVTDVTGHIVSHPEADLVGSPVRAESRLGEALTRWEAAGAPLRSNALAVSDTQSLGAVAGIPVANWLLWRLEQRQDVMAPLAAARDHALRTGALVAGVLAVALLAALWWLLRPLRVLTARSARLFDDPQDPDLGWPTAQGEIGELVDVLKQVGTSQRQLERQNTAVLRQLRSVMTAAPLGIMLTRDRRFELVSAEACRMLGLSENQLLGQPAQTIFASNEAYQQLGSKVAASFLRRDPYVGEQEFLGADGRRFWGRLRGQAVDWEDPGAGTIWTLADISEQVVARAQLEWAASHDSLTGLANRNALQHRLDSVLAARPQSKPAALLMLDLDRFKPVNDAHGHAAGDAVLRGVVGAITGCVRGGDLVARIGGDEFAVLLERCPSEVAHRVAADISAAVAACRVAWSGASLTVGVSVGVAVLSDELADTAAWMAAADAACYEAKGASRKSVDGALRKPLRLIRPETSR